MTINAVLPSIESFVQTERGLRFKHPVKATLLRGKAFVQKLDSADGAPSAKDVEQAVADLSSLGLVPASTNLAKAFKTADDATTIGFYDDKTKKLYVRGKRATPGVEAVLAHELTHALTDQWFNLHRPKLDKGNQELGLGFTGLIEGDAERTRIAFEHKVLTPAQRRQAEHEEGGGPTPKVPRVLLELEGLPYAVGPDFVRALVTDGGVKALNAAYRHPPTSSEQLLDPTAYFAHDDPKHVATPPSDGARLDHGDLGEIGLLLMFEHGLTRNASFTGVTGWGGDQYSAWRAGAGRYCLRDTVTMDYGLANAAFDRELAKWVKSRHGAAHIESTGRLTTFVTCSS